MNQRITNLVRLLLRSRIDLSDEKRAQSDVEYALANAGLPCSKEYELSKGDVVDFMVGDIALELKLRGAKKMAIYRQLKRYAKHEAVGSIVLASNLSMGMPEQIEGKDVYFVKLGEAWL